MPWRQASLLWESQPQGCGERSGQRERKSVTDTSCPRVIMQPFFFLLMSLKSSHSYKWNSLRLVFKVLLKRPALQRVPAASCVSILTQWLLWCNIAYGFCFCGCPPSELPSISEEFLTTWTLVKSSIRVPLWKWKDHILLQPLWQPGYRCVIWARSAGHARLGYWLRKYQCKEISRKTENLF